MSRENGPPSVIAPTPLEAARAAYAWRAAVAQRHAITCHDTWRSPCHQWINARVDAASVALDMVVAEHYAGRHPRLWSREIPTG